MPVSAPDQHILRTTQHQEHAACFLCGATNPAGFKLAFELQPDGTVRASVPCPRMFQSYEGTLHGGVVAALLDSAMTNCLFARGVAAVTARLDVRYRHPVCLDEGAEVTASVSRLGTRHLLLHRRTHPGRTCCRPCHRHVRSPPFIPDLVRGSLPARSASSRRASAPRPPPHTNWRSGCPAPGRARSTAPRERQTPP